MSVDADPWERLDNETSRAYLAFRQFRDLGPGARAGLAPQVPGKLGTNRGLVVAAGSGGRTRARAWNSEQYRARGRPPRVRAEIRTMGETHQAIRARAMIAARVADVAGAAGR